MTATSAGELAIAMCGVTVLVASVNLMGRAYGMSAVRAFGALLMRAGRALYCVGQVIQEGQERYRELKDLWALSTGVNAAESARERRT